ncbi:unnamed protein product [Phaeothamnion confervicola]
MAAWVARTAPPILSDEASTFDIQWEAANMPAATAAAVDTAGMTISGTTSSAVDTSDGVAILLSGCCHGEALARTMVQSRVAAIHLCFVQGVQSANVTHLHLIMDIRRSHLYCCISHSLRGRIGRHAHAAKDGRLRMQHKPVLSFRKSGAWQGQQ